MVGHDVDDDQRGAIMKWFSWLHKEDTTPVTLESFKQSPGKVVIDENGYAGLSPEAVDQIDKLRQSKGWGVKAKSPAMPWWNRLFQRRSKGPGKTDMSSKIKVVPLSLTRPYPFVRDVHVSAGMSSGILRPLVGRGRSEAN